MRRESSTVVVLVGGADEVLLAGLGKLPNVSVARAPADDAADGGSVGAGSARAADLGPAGSGWQPGALALSEAVRRRSTYVIVANDPLAEVAGQWQQMWSGH